MGAAFGGFGGDVGDVEGDVVAVCDEFRVVGEFQRRLTRTRITRRVRISNHAFVSEL